MKLAVMPVDLVPWDELRSLGFAAMQMFFKGTIEDESGDPSPAQIDQRLGATDLALAAMTLHIDLVGPRGHHPVEVQRAVRCVEKTAALKGRFGDNAKPLLIWHPSRYPEGPEVDDRAVFDGLCQSLGTLCAAAEQQDIYLVVEITRAGSVGSAETFLHLKDRIGSPALRVCFDGANFTPDRTPLERAVRMLGPDIVIAHGKDMWFTDSGEVGGYCATGSGKLDYGTYIRCLQEHAEVPYIVFEACGSREELLEARDTVQKYL